jgi:hypothetical protein
MQDLDEWGHKPKQGWQLTKGQQVNAEDLGTWLREMSKWALHVRRDIRRIEDSLGLPPGDPGPPPPPPAE